MKNKSGQVVLVALVVIGVLALCGGFGYHHHHHWHHHDEIVIGDRR